MRLRPGAQRVFVDTNVLVHVYDPGGNGQADARATS